MEDRRYPVLMTGGGKAIFFSLPQNIQTGVVAQPTSYLMVPADFPGLKQTGLEANRSPILEPKLRLNGAVPQIPHMPS
jgi:hypothetical protein